MSRRKFDPIWRGVVAPGEAARIMGVPFARVFELAEREGIDHTYGFQVQDLVGLATKLYATTRDPEEKARFRAAVSTFRAIRDEAA